MATVDWDNLKNNSRSAREADTDSDISERKMQQVGTGRSKTMKKPLRKRFLETFIADDVTKKDIGEYILKDVVVPSIQDAIMDGVNGALGMMFGINIVRKGSRSASSSSSGKIRYGGYFTGGNSTKKETASRATRERTSSTFEVQMKDNKQDALDIMEELENYLAEYPENGVTVADYYDAFGVSTEHTDNKWGWRDLTGMRLERVPRAFYDEDTRRYLDGWAVVMPREISL